MWILSQSEVDCVNEYKMSYETKTLLRTSLPLVSFLILSCKHGLRIAFSRKKENQTHLETLVALNTTHNSQGGGGDFNVHSQTLKPIQGLV